MDTHSSLFIPPHQTCQRFTLAEIQSATHNFDDTLVIGRGGFGKVYKCPSKIGEVSKVAIKRLNNMSNQGAHEFEAEVKVLSKLRHGNLVSLVGYCIEEKEMALVYEFMPNGTLEDHLRKPDCALSWSHRLKICIGAARGLDYLHTGTSTQHGVIHRDVKTSNILLDSNFAAKISDFGLAKVGPTDQTQTYVSTAVKGTFGYMDPCYFYTGKLTRKSDVYAFGVVLFEVLTGKQAVDSTLDEEQWGLAAWAQDRIKEGKLDQIIDPRLMGQISKKCMKEFASIARQCLRTQPKQRPTMAEVVVKLVSILSQERESANSVIDEGRFIYKVMSFFTGKVDMMPDRAVGRKSVTPDEAVRRKSLTLNGAEGNKSMMPDDAVGRKSLTGVGGSKSMMTDSEVGSIYVMPDGIVGRKSDFSALHIHLSKTQSVRHFTYAEVVRATNNFKHKEHYPTLNEPIYKAWVDERTYAPTKYGVGLAIYVRKKYIETWKLDLELEDFNHPNLIKLLGYCSHWGEFYCFYELVPGTSLDKYLFREPGTTSLSWVGRLKIAVGAAQGLAFLHQRKYPAYSQFKTNCILVDMDFNARLSDIEVENLYGTRERFNYVLDKMAGISSPPPEDGDGVKGEIYAFGVVLLEILTGLKLYDEKRSLQKQNLVEWATPFIANEVKLGLIVDPQLQHNGYPPRGAFKLAQLALNCLQPTPDGSPSMEEIVQVLCKCYEREINSVSSQT